MGDFLENAEENVSVDSPLVGLIKHNDRILTEVLVHKRLSQQHTISHVLDDSLAGSMVLETDRIAHLIS